MNGWYEIKPRRARRLTRVGIVPATRESPSGVNINAKGEQLLLCCLSG